MEVKQVLGKVKKTYPKICKKPSLCRPADWFGIIEECKICKRKL